MHQALGVILALAALGVLAGTVQRAQSRGGGKSPRARNGGWLDHRRKLRQVREKHRLDSEREREKHEHRLEEQEQRAVQERERDREWRERGGEGQPPRRPRLIRLKPETTDGGPQAPGGGTRERSRPAPGTTPPPGPAPDRPRRRPGPDEQPTAPDPTRTPGPASQPPSTPAPAPANGGTAPVTSTAVVEDLITAIDRIRAQASAGGIKAKLAALKACSAACTRFAQMASMLAKQLAELHYGTEITEPASTAATHLTAAASAFSESANALATLLNLRLGEVPESGRQAPHHAELSETGAR